MTDAAPRSNWVDLCGFRSKTDELVGSTEATDAHQVCGFARLGHVKTFCGIGTGLAVKLIARPIVG